MDLHNHSLNSGTLTKGINIQGTPNTNWNFASVIYSGTPTWYGYIAPQLYSTNGGYSGTNSIDPITSSSNLYMGVGLINTISGYQYQSYYNWIRVRVSPPNGILPATTFGSVTLAGCPVSRSL